MTLRAGLRSKALEVQKEEVQAACELLSDADFVERHTAFNRKQTLVEALAELKAQAKEEKAKSFSERDEALQKPELLGRMRMLEERLDLSRL